MSREIKEDFDELSSFLKNYTISPMLDNSCYLAGMKSIHKSYLPMLTFVAEFSHKYSTELIVVDRIKECSSDLGFCLFLIAHGAYKPANVMLRSSIENFIKSITYNHDCSVLTEKKVHLIFSKCESMDIFTQLNFKNMFNEIKQIYGELCAYVHTAEKINMAHISALCNLPSFNQDTYDYLSIKFKKLVLNYLKILTFIYKSVFFTFNINNRKNILSILPKSYRRFLVEEVYEPTT